MKTSATILLFALLSSAAGASLADVHVYVNCKAPDAHCPPPPKPPRPPLPPAPPTPPAPPAPDLAMAHSPADAAMPAVPAVPAPPAIPAPPPPPRIPPVPDSAHADCATKKPGTRLSFTLRPNETMTGVCQRQGGRMVFSLREYALTE